MPFVAPPPHVFIIHADLRMLVCDGWAVPTGGGFNIASKWFSYPAGVARPDASSSTRLTPTVTRVNGWSGSLPYMVKVSGAGVSAAGMADVAVDFLRTAAGDLRDRSVPPLNRRAKHLLCIPILGTGGGGARHAAGEVVRSLLPAVMAEARSLDVDVAIVTNEPEAYAAAQATRRKMVFQFPLPKTLFRKARNLAQLANSGQLCLFLGAGISAGAGLPTWGALLDTIGARCGLGKPSPPSAAAGSGSSAAPPTSATSTPAPTAGAASGSVGGGPLVPPMARQTSTEDALRGLAPPPLGGRSASSEERRSRARLTKDRTEFEKMSFLDRARVLQRRLEAQGVSLGQAVADALKTNFVSIAHALVAALPCNEVVTTNYDQLYELAASGIGLPPTVLPYETAVRGNRWLLKLHGCVHHPDHIVLTRQDYIRFEAASGALSGVVQGALLTKHMLFLGFALEDDNFHRLFDEVQKSRPATGSHPLPPAVSRTARKAARKKAKKAREGRAPPASKFGTVLTLHANRLQRELWSDTLDFCYVHEDRDMAEVLGRRAPSSRASSVTTAADDAPSIAELARVHDIVLDCISFHAAASNAANVLDPRFKSLLSPDELLLRAAITSFVKELSPSVKKLPAYEHVATMLAALGGNGPFKKEMAMIEAARRRQAAIAVERDGGSDSKFDDGSDGGSEEDKPGGPLQAAFAEFQSRKSGSTPTRSPPAVDGSGAPPALP